MLSVTVKNKPNLTSAMEFFIEGDRLDGDNRFFCDRCKAKVDAVKRAVLHNLPPLLMVHLKRFEFNFDTMRKVCASAVALRSCFTF